MKKIILFVMMLAITITSFATIRTVNNFVNGAAQFTDLQLAINASINGDTIYLQGSPTNYGSATISNKRIILIGPGFAPNKQLPQVAQVNAITLINDAVAGNVDSSEIQGITFVGGSGVLMQSTSGQTYNNIRILRNIFNSGCQLNLQNNNTYTNMVIQNNYFSNSAVIASTSGIYNSFLIQNNVFYAQIFAAGASIQNFGTVNSSNILFEHNLVTGNISGGNSAVLFSQCSGLLFTNNIFINRTIDGNISSSTFTDNLTFNTLGNTAPWASFSNVEGSTGSNINNQNPQMADQASVDAGTNSALLNYTIATGMANNAGSDGKDLGLLFNTTGSLNWDNARTSRLPFVFSMNVTNPTITPGQTISVQVEARRSN